MLFGIELGDLCRIYTSVVLLPALSCCHSWTPLLCSACPLPPPQLVQAKLLEVFQETAAARHAQQAAGQERVLAVLRSDYMLHTPTNSLLQVELNTIASSFGCLSTLVGRMHRYLLGRLGPARLSWPRCRSTTQWMPSRMLWAPPRQSMACPGQ